jgi:prolyl 4-hydroxylase
LEIEDHQGKKHQLILKPGEIILYESALLDHGRPSPLEGNKFVNVFCHYMPHIS